MKNMPKKTAISLVVATMSATTLVNHSVEANALGDIQQVTNATESGSETPISKGYIHLSNLNWIEEQSSVGWGEIKKDENYDNNKITLQLDGEAAEFSKGLAAHAISTLVFDVSQYSQTYTRFTSYVGVDYSRGNNGNGVKFTISKSNDGQHWTELATTDVLKGNTDAVFIDVDIEGAKYLKLYAHHNGNDAADHAVYASPRLMTADYDISTETISGIKTVAQYDKEIREKYEVDQQLSEELKLLLLQRTFTDRIGYHTLQNIAAQGTDYLNTINWLLNNKQVLELYVLGGTLEKGASYTNSINVLTDLYAKYNADFNDAQNGELYLKMAISLSLSHAKEIKFWTGNSVPSNAATRYAMYKEIYTNGTMASGINAPSTELFKNLPVELMRWVMDNQLDDEQMTWLIDYSLDQKAKGRNYLDAYNYISYRHDFAMDYDRDIYYSEENYDQWNEKYNIKDLTGYGERGFHKLWMVFEDGAVCGGLAKTYANLDKIFGMPAGGIGQPGHGATLTYRLNSEGKGVWHIQNDISGFKESEKGERFPLDWGSKTNSWVSYYNVSYILLGQHSLNNYDDFITASYYNFLADVYKTDTEKQIEIYNEALKVQNYNLDSLVGLINTYKNSSNKTSADYLELAKKIAEGQTFFPLPFVDLMKLMEPLVTDDTDKVVFDMLKTTTLQRATQATAGDSTQYQECINIAKYLLGTNTMELASFSFDGENAGKIMIDESYANSNIRWEYSLDNWQTKKETGDKEVTLTEDELNRINVTDDIQISLVGTSEIYTIDITEQQAPTIYANDLENQIKGATAPLEYSEDGGNTWKLYEDERFTGDRTLKVRYRASGTKLQSDVSECSFTQDIEQADRKYIPLENVSLYLYSSQNNNKDHAAINMIDGNIYTGWHNTFNGERDKYYSVEFNQARYLTAMEYFGDGGNGKLKDVDIYTSMDGINWEKNTEIRNIPNNNEWKVLNLTEPTLTKYVMIHAISTHGARPNEFITGKILNFFEDTTKEMAPEVTVTYNTEELTNQDVVATINLPQGYEVVGDATHTFTENGTHTFIYQSPTGKEYTHEVTVNWIDKVAPTATISYSTTNKTNQSVVATLNIQEENITIENNKTSHVFDSNGEYIFTIRDQAGNRAEVKATVTWINKEKPVLDVTYSTEEETDQPVMATLITEDVQVKSINGKVITVTNNNGNKEYIFIDNGEFTFEYIDDYGNTGSTTAKVDWIVKIPDVEATDIKVTYSEPHLTNQDVTATIELPEGYTIIGDATHTFTQNGTHTFTYQSVHGTQYTHTITVDWIDKVAPTATVTYSNENQTNQNVIATLNVLEENITIENNNGEASYEFNQNDEFTFIIRDQAGNRAEVKAAVTWINKETPVLDVMYSTTEETDQPVLATLVTEDVQIKAINGKVITVTNNNGRAEYIFTDNGEFTFEYVDDYGNTGSTKAEVNWIVKTPMEETPDNGAGNETPDSGTDNETPEQPNYIIPDSIKPFIDLNVVSVSGGNATQNDPLSLQVLDSVDIDTLTTMIESFGAYRLTFERKEQQDQLSMITYVVTIQNESETYHLTMTVAEDQNEIINYLDSLIEDQATADEQPSTDNNVSGATTPESKPSTDSNESGATTPESKPSTDNNESSTTNSDNKPETGMTLNLPLILGGIMTTLSGIVATYKNRRK